MTERYLPRSKEELKQAVANYCGLKHDRSHGPIGTWDTSLITDMSYLFYHLREFNDSIADWNTSSVTNMEGCLKDAPRLTNRCQVGTLPR